jgi:hypothetical protein
MCGMKTNSSPPPSMVTSLIQGVLPYFPPLMRTGFQFALPSLSIQASRLGFEVMDAEQRGLRYSEAVKLTQFPMMSHVYYGAADLLQWRLPAVVRKAFRPLIAHAAAGTFDPTRKLLFAIARNKDDPEAAMCRFLLWAAIRMNLLVYTWNKPETETFGVLSEMEDMSEEKLRELLDVTDMHESDIRPLHVLVAGMLERTRRGTDRAFVRALKELGTELDELMTETKSLGIVRNLEARCAATLAPLLGNDPIGSQQIVDRYPQHFDTVSAVESLRSRLRKKIDANALEPANDRFIDLLRADIGGKQ